MANQRSIRVNNPNSCLVDDAMRVIQKPLLNHVIDFLKYVYKDEWWDHAVLSYSLDQRESVKKLTDDKQRKQKINDTYRLLKIIKYSGYDRDYYRYKQDNPTKYVDRDYAGVIFKIRNEVPAHPEKEITEKKAEHYLTSIMEFIKPLDEVCYNEIEKLNQQLPSQYSSERVVSSGTNSSSNGSLPGLTGAYEVIQSLMKQINELADSIRKVENAFSTGTKLLNNSEEKVDFSVIGDDCSTRFSTPCSEHDTPRALHSRPIPYESDDEYMICKRYDDLFKDNIPSIMRDSHSDIDKCYYSSANIMRESAHSLDVLIEMFELKEIGEAPDTDVRSILEMAEDGNSEAQFRAGIMYYWGDHVRQSYEVSFYWFSEAARQDIPRAHLFMGIMYFLGRGVGQSYTDAFVCFKNAATMGNVGAQYCVGRMYSLGIGTEPSEDDAFRWYSRAAERDNPDAMFELGMMYYQGICVKPSQDDAKRLFLRAAELGDSKSKSMLHSMSDVRW